LVDGLLVVTGTGTEIGKTVVTAGVAALALAAGRRVAVLKPAQTGVVGDEPGDVAEIDRLADGVTGLELARFPEPLAPATAARRSGRDPVRASEIVVAAEELIRDHDVVLVEGAGGLLVHYDDEGSTLADAARALDAPVVMVSAAGLGALNSAALTAEALRTRGVRNLGTVVGAWPAEPDLACRCNLVDFPKVTGLPLVGALPERATATGDFADTAHRALAPSLGGCWDAAEFVREWAA
jgi:dethiobiotin synthetase